ncbi:mycobactin polyketide synthase MbtD [Mycolicibacterium sp. P9-22]|uniref:mycobactin polyketide synthase MbtD n=1 Tax=Mycolicibacterium sp. P9-22 TaxID=2024613 RepID=UPI0011F07896|nr:mycobactin polyketide synthase MbtD [Mycolicibacterium sp. P9-22]KAA0120416.1 SDR family NAD(P)-dependent oxidoreductase [Mycolicibacterium sp. P9-22]
MTTITALPDGRTPVLLSAHAAELIGQDAAAILDHLQRRPALSTAADVARVAATLAATRRVRKFRTMIRAADIAELADALRAVQTGAEHPLVTRSAQTREPRVAFVFPGQGSQWPSMGVEAYHRLTVYRDEADRCATAFTDAGHASPLSYLLADPGARTNDFSQVQIQGAQFVHGVALARVWQSCGVTPDITVGHSLGEIGAAHIAGAITLADAVGVVAARATVLDGLTGPYRVAVLGIDPEQARDEIAQTPGWLELSVVNSKSSVAVSGDTEAIAALVRRVSESGRFAKEIEMWFPAHTTKLDTSRAELGSMLPAGRFDETPVPFIGSATAQVVPAGTDFADYWYTNLRSTVRFDDAVRAAFGAGAQTFVELSAHPALLYAMADVLDEVPDPPLMVGSGRRDEPLVERLSAGVAAVALAGPGSVRGEQSGELLRDFPFAPMRAQHHWAAPEPLPPVPGLKVLTERWVPHTPAASGPRRAAIVDLGDDGRLAAALRSRLDIADPVEADLLIVLAPALEHLDAVAAGNELAARIDTGLLRYTDAVGPRCRDVWLVTVGGEQVRIGEPGPLPAQAALAAMHRSIGLENPDQSFGHLDLPSWELDEAVSTLAVAALAGATAQVALRHTDSGPALFGYGTVEDRLPQPGWGAPGVLDEVVITGGSGAVGTHFVNYLAAHGARRIVLLGRNGAEPRRVSGVEVLAPPCDITDPAALAVTAAEFGGDGASLVIHAAGAATMIGHRDLTGAVFAEAVSAKVCGLAAFTASWPVRPDARIVLCSSVSGLWGGSGHTAYSAANRLLDVMAGQLRADGRHCTSVRWGLWPAFHGQTGIIDADEIARVERSGLTSMTPERAVETCLRDFAGDPLVFSADAARLQVFLGEAPAEPTTAGGPEPSLDGLDAAGVLRVALASVLNLPADTALEPSASLLDLGVDSLLALDLRKKLKTAAGVNVPLATILGGATVAEVLEHLERPEKKARLK